MTRVSTKFKDEDGLPAVLLKVEKPGDVSYLYEYYRASWGDVPDDYVGYVIEQYIDSEMCSKRIITLGQYLKELQKQINRKQRVVDEITKYVQ